MSAKAKFPPGKGFNDGTLVHCLENDQRWGTIKTVRVCWSCGRQNFLLLQVQDFDNPLPAFLCHACEEKQIREHS